MGRQAVNAQSGGVSVMALLTLTDLTTAVGQFLNRDDLTAITPTFVLLAEAQIQRDVRHWQMIKTVSYSLTTRYTTLPTDWVETIRLALNTDGGAALQMMSVDAMQAMRSDRTSAEPLYYAHIGGQLEVYPTPNATYTAEHVYYGKITALSGATNWLMTDHPDVYLYGSLLQSAPYVADDARLTVWGSLYSAAVSKLNAASRASQWSGSGLKIRSAR